MVSNCLVATILSHRYNSRRGSGETKVESHASSDTQPNQAALLLNTARIQPGSQPHQCVGGNTVHLATWSACPPQESLVCDETRLRQSLSANPESLVAQLALQYSALSHCATREAHMSHYISCLMYIYYLVWVKLRISRLPFQSQGSED